MCGIVGYVGGRQAYPILVKGLTRLEYRGYDSAGVALVNDNGDLVVYKTKGKVKDLERTAEGKDVSGTVGIAHTRWATHGEPSDVNSHPHYSENHHNGFLGCFLRRSRAALVQELQDIPDKIAKILEHDAQIADLAKVFTYSHNFLYGHRSLPSGCRCQAERSLY